MTDHTVTWAAGGLASHLAHRARLLEVILADDEASPGAQSFEQDRTSGHSTVTFCWEHQQDPSDCHRQERWVGDTTGVEVPKLDRQPCTGESIATPTDSVGELVVSGRPLRARGQLAVIAAAEMQIVKAMEVIDKVRDQVLGPVVLDRATVRGVAKRGDPGCESCERLIVVTERGPEGWWNEPLYNQGRPTDFGGKLSRKYLLCKPCANWILNHDHDVCIAQNEAAKKASRRGGKVKKIPYAGPWHLPPVEGTEQCLRHKHDTSPSRWTVAA